MLHPLLCLALLFLLGPSPSSGAKHINVVLFGATGDLAKKYLWASFFEIFRRETQAHGTTFSIYAVARAPYSTGAPDVYASLSERLPCPAEDEGCAAHREAFINITRYTQVKTAEHYEDLGMELNATGAVKALPEAGRLFYLSIPPASYAAATEGIHKHCRLHPDQGWTRVVLEKPFGSDYASALELVNRLSEYLREEEIYRIDHYLGKESVAQIIPFRHLNRKQFEPLWNKEHVQRVEIVMKEELDAEGRTAFYDQYGVIRDVMQNHLTEMLALVAMDLPANMTDLTQMEASKLAVLEQLRPVSNDSIVAGQYKTYNAHLQKDNPERAEAPSSTATFAATALHVDNRRWFGVPFIMTAGKALEERVGYIRIVFRSDSMKLSMRSRAHEVHPAAHTPPLQLVFYIGHGPLGSPAILCTKTLAPPRPTLDWHVSTDVPNTHLLGVRMEDYYILVPDHDINAYLRLVDNVYKGDRSLFVSSQSLLLSWRAWDEALKNPPKPLHYDPRDESLLQFEYTGGSFRVAPEGKVTGREQFAKFSECAADEAPKPIDTLLQIREFLFSWLYDDRQAVYGKAAPTTFRGHAMIPGQLDTVLQTLADSILEAALQVVYQERRVFHLALSGGSSPLRLLQLLAAQQQASGFPWTSTHIWMVDDRCVPLDDSRSNFLAVAELLLPFVPIPYLHVHPLPCQRCTEEAAGEYETDMRRLLHNNSLDYLVLGVGDDGHTASLFPNSEALREATRWVVLTQAPASTPVVERMSLSYTVINAARTVAVFIIGASKRPVVAKLSDPKANFTISELPIVGVRPHHGRLIWYIDNAAL